MYQPYHDNTKCTTLSSTYITLQGEVSNDVSTVAPRNRSNMSNKLSFEGIWAFKILLFYVLVFLLCLLLHEMICLYLYLYLLLHEPLQK